MIDLSMTLLLLSTSPAPPLSPPLLPPQELVEAVLIGRTRLREPAIKGHLAAESSEPITGRPRIDSHWSPAIARHALNPSTSQIETKEHQPSGMEATTGFFMANGMENVH